VLGLAVEKLTGGVITVMLYQEKWETVRSLFLYMHIKILSFNMLCLWSLKEWSEACLAAVK